VLASRWAYVMLLQAPISAGSPTHYRLRQTSHTRHHVVVRTPSRRPRHGNGPRAEVHVACCAPGILGRLVPSHARELMHDQSGPPQTELQVMA